MRCVGQPTSRPQDLPLRQTHVGGSGAAHRRKNHQKQRGRRVRDIEQARHHKEVVRNNFDRRSDQVVDALIRDSDFGLVG